MADKEKRDLRLVCLFVLGVQMTSTKHAVVLVKPRLLGRWTHCGNNVVSLLRTIYKSNHNVVLMCHKTQLIH